jgi:hypothetical protein
MGGMQERCRKREKTGGASHIGRTGEIGESVYWIGKAARGGGFLLNRLTPEN